MGVNFAFNWELQLIEWLQNAGGSVGVALASFFTMFGEELILIAILGFIYWCWDKEYGKEMNGLTQSDAIPSVDEMMANLEKEVVADVAGGKSVADLKYVITPADEAAGVEEAAIRYGQFIQNIVDFIIVALVIFLVLKAFLAMKKKFEKPEEPEEPKEEEEPAESELDVLKEIRDSLKKEGKE